MLKRILTYTVLPVALVFVLCFFLFAGDRETIAPNAAANADVAATPMVRSASFSAKGIVQTSETVRLLAPIGGQVEDFDWKAGDRIAEGELAFAIKATQVGAGNDGIIRSLQCVSGDLAQDIQTQYGALCYIERDDVWRIPATTSGTYDDPENRDIYVGQVVRIQHGTGDSKVRGEGIVIAVNGKDFTAELPRGDFEIEDSVKLYLESSKDNASKEQIGSGKIARAAAVPVLGDGIIASVLVTEGDRVARGQALFLLDQADARYTAQDDINPEVRVAQGTVIEQILVSPGQNIVQAQPVMTLLPDGQVEALLNVDELDISKVDIGQHIRLAIDSHGVERTGTVTEIRPLGQTVLDTTKFEVKVQSESADDLMIGMHVTGYWD